MLTPLTPDLLDALASKLPQGTLRAVAPRYLEEPRAKWQGVAAAVAAPQSVAEVSIIVAFAAAHRVALLPYGGGTGLVGGQLTAEGAPLLLSLERMNRVREVLPSENAIVVEAGCTLQAVQDAALAAERLFPLSIGSKGTAQIGGNLATNAGGINVLRYGNARDLALGLEAVLPDGRVWNGLTRLRKDNTGYDLRNLLIGSEGTLGVITAAALKLFARPAQTGTALFAVQSPAAALSLLAHLRAIAGETVSAFELLHRQGLEFVAEKLPDLRQPWPQPPEWMVLTELGLARGPTPQALFEELFETALQEGLASDGIIAQSEAQSAALWSLREAIPIANKAVGSLSSHDISLPLGDVAGFIPEANAALAAHGDYRINCFGHLGDGNLHYNVFPAAGRNRASYGAAAEEVQSLVHELVVRMGGSFSAEHGLGRLKTADLERYADPAKLTAMRAIKSALDPQGIMNPGAVLRQKG
ncbi:FAD-binding oxidoreductase [uncultured Lentibacter sp.]|uniref:FAD-binding oxidoreductase n=1 Tax=uncultured Lentibacter sp. TaxID=1659309 RepID=UPI00262544C9|nr:FAD-binding oxidoreductase [uncultured Lentibacter sp.]